MAVRNNQKMVVFANKDLINTLVHEEACRKNINDSNVIEETLLSAMLTQNESVSSWLKRLYSGGITISMFMEKIWDTMGEKEVTELRIKENIKLVRLAREMAIGEAPDINHNKFGNNYNPSYLNRHLGCIAKLCEQAEVVEKDAEYVKAVVADIRELTQIYNADNRNIRFDDIYKILIEVWDYIYKDTYTYIVLSELAKLQRNYNMSWRYVIRQTLVELSKYW